MERLNNKFADFLIEIGTEEIPSSYLPPASNQMRKNFEKFLKENSLTASKVITLYTPRRLALLVKKLSSHQKDRPLKILGPPSKLCFDEDGNPTQMLKGFAISQGVKPNQVKVTRTEKGEYVYIEKLKKGKATSTVLREYLPSLIKSITFPKSMRWLGDDFRFARPIRWILALYDGKVIRFTLASVKSGNYTWGHRILCNRKILVRTPSEYLQKLKRAYVIVDPAERLAKIKSGIEKQASQAGGTPLMDEELLREVNNLVEYPISVLGSFDRAYLRLPKEVVVTAMKVHQRYFGIIDKKGKLLPYFIAVVSGDKGHIGDIVDGNERVLQARLADALFYWDTDRKIPLFDRIDSLKRVVWLEGLGSLYDKTERLVGLGTFMASTLKPDIIPVVERAAWLSKTDLVTSMIKDGKEFTTLEGKIGMEYALQSGESKDVAIAIYEHYLPRYPGDLLPKTFEGAILAVADKLDTVVGGFIAGFVPTGSQDPQGLRRHALGIISIIAERSLRVSLTALVDESLKAFENQNLLKEKTIREDILNFFKTRIENWLEEEGFRYDLVDAVLSTRYDDPTDVKKRVNALNELRSSPDFIKLAIAQKRVANILKDQSKPPPVKKSLLLEEAECQLFSALRKLEPDYFRAIRKGEYRKALRQLLSLRAPIDRLFDEVLIMTEKQELRMNRLALVKYAKDLFNEIGDLSKIVIE